MTVVMPGVATAVRLTGIVVLASSLYITSAMADTAINLHGNLVIPDCVVNNNNTVTVDFGDVDIQALPVAHTLYVPKTFSVPLDCPYTLGIPKLTVTAAVATGGLAQDGTIRTTKDSEGLVVYLREQDGSTPVTLNPGAGKDISSSVSGSSGTSRTLRLNAGIGQLNGVDKLMAGSFTATASLQVRYE